MPLLLPAVISNARSQHPFVLLESSSTQSALPVFKDIINHGNTKTCLLFCLLYPPTSILNEAARSLTDRFRVIDRTSFVPGFSETSIDDLGELFKRELESAQAGSLTVAIDSIDTLCADLGSASKCHLIVFSLLNLLRTRSFPAPSRLIIHTNSPTPVLPLLLLTRLSPNMTHVMAHPPALLEHIAETHLAVPPPSMPPERFWRVFSPIAARGWEVEHLVYGPEGPGSGPGREEFVLEMVIRGQGAGSDGKRRGTERVLEGWSRSRGSCELTELSSLRVIWTKSSTAQEPLAPDPTQNLPFNLNLTRRQQQSRAQVPLPYVHEGEPVLSETPTTGTLGAIYYDPDSADDIDDDDPDEDLDI
ncbi:hypothetical protein K488DRAFT_79530 [Vararia minispora EC-137]|uniref:Uncharacterized protein n=1 Tax=Vararia minispora EC-137 TaxID=1314806 RepID=A0ACB8QGF4_9AGAM|nr:hypothetical protein K488DRAFT_79530 [Vararia minispora EC-137]